MAKLNLEELLGGLQEAAMITQSIAEKQHINNLSKYFDPDGNPITVTFNIPSPDGKIKNIKVEFEQPQLIWSKYPLILDKITQDRIVSEVYKTSHGSNIKLKELIGEDFNFVTMNQGLNLMLNTKND